MMVLRLDKQLPQLLIALVGASVVASLPQVDSAWTGVKEVYGEQDFGLRILRELMLLVVIGFAVCDARFRRIALSAQVWTVATIIAAYVLMETVYALYLDLPLIVPVAGMRVFEYVPMAVIGLAVARIGAGDSVLIRFTRYLRYYVAFQGILALAQAILAPPLFGVSILGGGRPFGTFVSPNLFGAAMSTCTLFFAIMEHPRLRRWMYASAFLALLSGSRTALLASLLVIFFRMLSALRARDRWALVLPAPLLAVGALALASSPMLSGRDDADPTQDGRIDRWDQVLGDNINSAVDLLFGWGLGLSSNTINVLFGAEFFPGQFDSDSLYLYLWNGYGLIGLLAYLGAVWSSGALSAHAHRGMIMTFIFVAGLPFNLWEYFPQNAMLMFLWGVVMGTSRPRHLQMEAQYAGVPNSEYGHGR